MASNRVGPSSFTFLSGFVQSRDIGRVIAQFDALAERGVALSSIMKWTESLRQWSAFRVHWVATRMWVVVSESVTIFVTGPDGIVSVTTGGKSVEERIDDSENGPKGRGPIRDLRGIGNHLYACGMSRQVYRRKRGGGWSRWDEGVLARRGVPKRGGLQVVGFNSIDGLDEGDIYAVGFGGEIWHRADSKWHQLDSPTNLILHRVRVIGEDLIYASGQKGVILRGTRDGWRHIDHSTTTDDLWGMEWFNGALYVASDNAIYRLAEEEIERVNMSSAITTFGHLHANDGVLWSFGRKNLVWTENGVDWHQVTP